MKKNAFIWMVFLLLIPGYRLYCQFPDKPMMDIPAEFRALYDELETQLETVQTFLDGEWDGTLYPVAFCTELLAASPNRGEKILEPQVLEAVKFNLDAFVDLGVTAVSMDIKYPALNHDFPRSDEYLEFFKDVVAEVRQRGLILFIAMQTAFTDSVFGKLGADYTGLTLETYIRDKTVMAETIINELAPDYLTLENEPDTQARNTGLDFSVDNVILIMQSILDSLDRGETKIGAGAGTWDNPEYFTRLAEETDIDYLDIHVYPINGDLFTDKMLDVQAAAQANNKSIIIGESWLYKISNAELAAGTHYIHIFPRDVFDFWIPLDIRFLQLMGRWSHLLESEVTSLFWMRYFWGYIGYNDTTYTLSPTQRYALVDQTVGQNMWSGVMTETGIAYQTMITGDTEVRINSEQSPKDPVLYAGYPNPFNSSTTLSFNLPEKLNVSLKIVSLFGRTIQTLVQDELEAGMHIVEWDGEGLPSGCYLVHLKTDRFLRTQKVVLLR